MTSNTTYMNLTTKLTFCLIIMVFGTLTLSAQESLQGQFEAMMNENSTYERYKVVPITDMNAYWAQIADTLQGKNAQISALQNEVGELRTQIDTLEQRVSSLQADLAASEQVNDQIHFIGIPFSKAAYHVMVWVIILILAVVAVIAYLMYIRSNKVTTRVKKDYDKLRHEYDAHRDKARETQVRLKRELQTAVNTIDEMKRGGGRR
ncbi:hypothetical protein [Marinoscillum furvescens]|uniref:Uncharacterized protein n=1 Tax=Marinoscillum furvescens DSM 4134 TaxID=1122208 RepID=A0A3D9KZ96_MARFU|nr:hypothetical protein [Marinoscillum furvescens]RED92065.1 hypothetical protein C7460_13334 [Marinoscillum furvescens DSM 4134]